MTSEENGKSQRLRRTTYVRCAKVLLLLALLAFTGTCGATESEKPWAWTSASARFDSWDTNSGKGTLSLDHGRVMATLFAPDGSVVYRFNGRLSKGNVVGILEVADTDIGRAAMKGSYEKRSWHGPSAGREALLLEGNALLIGVTRELDSPK